MSDFKFKDKFTLNIEVSRSSIWFITSPDIPKLSVKDTSFLGALTQVPNAVMVLEKVSEQC